MFAVWTWATRRGRTSHLRTAVAAVAALSFALAVYGSTHGAGFLAGFYSPVTRAWEFAAGALLALTPRIRWTRQGALVATGAGLGLLFFGLGEINGASPFPGWLTLIPVVASLLLISAGATDRAAIGALLRSRTMVRIGDWSYSIYLWHWPFIVFATLLWPHASLAAPIAALVSIVPALLSYQFLEQPIRSREFVPRALAVLVGITVLMPISIAGATEYAADHVWKPRVAAAPASAKAMHAGYAKGCHYEPGDGDRDPKPCVWNAQQGGLPVYLLGDSNAAQFVEGLIDATAATERPLIASTSSGCPLLDVEMEGPDFPGYGKACLARNLRLLQWMKTQRAGTVVLAASNDYWLDAGWTIAGAASDSRAARIAQMQASLQRVVKALQASGNRVVLVQTIPPWRDQYVWDPAKCTLAAALDGCIRHMPASYAIDATRDVQDAVAAVAETTGSRVIDVTSRVCPDGTCDTARGDLPVYRDASHITVAMSHRLAAMWQNELAAD